MNTVRSGSGWRTTIITNGVPVVSIWAHTERDSEYMAAREHMEQMRTEEDERAKIEQTFVEQQRAEYQRIRARA